jgi:hypothetical protein
VVNAQLISLMLLMVHVVVFAQKLSLKKIILLIAQILNVWIVQLTLLLSKMKHVVVIVQKLLLMKFLLVVMLLPVLIVLKISFIKKMDLVVVIA